MTSLFNNGTTGEQTNGLIGLKIEISPEIIREGDYEGGQKIFTLIPSHVDTVRSFKNYLATNVLKSHVPFYFYNGEYRILDEDDVRIFTLLTGPCRLLPVPQPRSALTSLSSSSFANSPAISSTSTPLGLVNGHSSKRVKFSDESYITAPKNSTFAAHGNLTVSAIVPDVSGNVSYDQTDTDAGKNESLDDSYSKTNNIVPADDDVVKKKRKRRRLHKSKRAKQEHSNSLSPNGNYNETGEDQLDLKQSKPKKKKRKKDKDIKEASSTPIVVDTPLGNIGSNNSYRQSEVVQEYDADESEMDHSQASQGKTNGHGSNATFINSSTPNPISFAKPKTCLENVQNQRKSSEFLSPNTAFLDKGYKRLRHSNSTSQNTPSFYNGSFISPSSASPLLSLDDSLTVEKRRRDTPMLPKVLKNPCATYQFVKKSLSFNGCEAEDHGDSCDTHDDQLHQQQDGGENGVSNGSSQSIVKTPISSMDDMSVGDRISFKVVELDEKYNPVISASKTAVVVGKNGSKLTLNYMESKVKQRSGVYEIEDEDLVTEELDDPAERDFSTLLEPHQLSKD